MHHGTSPKKVVIQDCHVLTSIDVELLGKGTMKIKKCLIKV